MIGCLKKFSIHDESLTGEKYFRFFFFFFFPDRAYTSVLELRDALLDEEIEGVLLDAYTAGDQSSLFADERLRAAAKLEYPRSYGFVLSGDLKNVAGELKDFLYVNKESIIEILTTSTEPMGVRR